MEPFSVVASVANIADAVTKLSSAIAQFRQDYKLADEDLDIARRHALLLKEEIAALESRKPWDYTPPRKSTKGLFNDSNRTTETSSIGMDESSFAKAMSTACGLLSDIEATFPLRSEPHTWRSRVRWAIKDKKVLARLKERLQSTESTLQGIVSMEQLRISQMVYRLLLNQQATMDRIEKGEIIGKKVIDMSVVNQPSPQSAPAVIQVQLSEVRRTPQPLAQVTNPKSTKQVPWAVRFNRWGFGAQIVTIPKGEGTSYRAGVQVSLRGRVYSVQLQMSLQDFSLYPAMHVRNTVPANSEMAIACKTGDFNRARELLVSGLAHGSDVTPSGWPMLDYAIESGSARLVRLLLDHGAEPDLAYGKHSMTALQSSFLRGELGIARVLIGQGADIEHVDSDGYSVLSYLWVNDGRMDKSAEFMRLCIANEFSEVNACDSRGWMPLHRAAAVGTPEDVEAFLKLGASLDLRADWYGWTALFFAASHDNVETFQTIVRHSEADVFNSLDGDGWNLLHCCTYFGAPRVMRLVLQNGIDVNQKSLPAPLPEDPELSYRELTASDIAIYMGPNRYKTFVDALADTGRDVDLEAGDDFFWDAVNAESGPDNASDAGKDEKGSSHTMYGAEDFDDRWTLLHWASYNGSPKVQRLLLLKGADPKHLDAIMMEENPTLLPMSPFEGR
ncbi:ankyrin repeat-containing domain protein [Aspergillus cavernicola]|uniref:Ankyrin repeat-containing domain protein n=1 Tax=Aspergillus cavernicola TaxID=176166 RepID=A0ABR4I5B8_9EURO